MGAALPGAAAKPKREEPCQEDFDAYMRCCKANGQTQNMNECEDIMAGFQQCMRAAKGSPGASLPTFEMPAGVLPEGMSPSQHVGPRSISAGLHAPAPMKPAQQEAPQQQPPQQQTPAPE
mmetsp:Transcript_103789/g.289147  ORF Transcript_103789/g.289147 Transcript_103789/m.289147 type:complete len:120 (-) Transcript_103789:69-428(-)